VLMLIPSTRFLGGIVILLSFAFIATQIRLGLLCEMVMVCGLLFANSGSAFDLFLARVMPAVAAPVPSAGFAGVTLALQCFLWAYLCLLPVAHAGMYFNFYAKKRLPGPLQFVLERYTNFFGMIIWRVFSVDVTNFWIDVYELDDDGGERLVSRWGSPLLPRYSHVCEAITVTCVFTTLKYYPSNPSVFHDRLLRYSRTVAREHGGKLLYRYMSMDKTAERFLAEPVAEYVVDVEAATIEERVLRGDATIRSAHKVSPVHEGVRPGTYVPLATR